MSIYGNKQEGRLAGWLGLCRPGRYAWHAWWAWCCRSIEASPPAVETAPEKDSLYQ